MFEKKKGNCPFCGGWGFHAEHDPYDPHINGECNSCPIQVPCEKCYTTGFLVLKKRLLIEKYKKQKIATIDDLPF